MSIQMFEIFHGAVLAKIMRSYGERPVILRLVESRPEEYWSVYTLNDEVHLVIKYRTQAHKLSKGGLSWGFVFSPEEVDLIRRLQEEKKVYVALVGGQRSIGETMEVGLLSDEEFVTLIQTNDGSGLALTMRYEPHRQLRIVHKRKVVYKVPLSRLDNWEVPGG